MLLHTPTAQEGTHHECAHAQACTCWCSLYLSGAQQHLLVQISHAACLAIRPHTFEHRFHHHCMPSRLRLDVQAYLATASRRLSSSLDRDTIWPRSFSTATAPGCSLAPLMTACRSSWTKRASECYIPGAYLVPWLCGHATHDFAFCPSLYSCRLVQALPVLHMLAAACRWFWL